MKIRNLQSHEYKIKSQLKKKISLFLENEFPLLLQSGLIDAHNLLIYINNISNKLPELGKEKVASPKVWNHTGILAQGSEFCNKIDDFRYINSKFKQNQMRKNINFLI